MRRKEKVAETGCIHTDDGCAPNTDSPCMSCRNKALEAEVAKLTYKCDGYEALEHVAQGLGYTNIASALEADNGVEGLRAEVARLTADLASSEEERDARTADAERYLWNLGGCSTYADSRTVGEPHSQDLALPALDSVRKAVEDLARAEAERDQYRTALVAVQHELGVPSPDYPAPVANAVNIITEALEITT